MRVPRIFLPTDLASGTRVLLPETAARHLVRVLRLGPGAPVRLFDGSGGEHMAALATVEKRQVTAQVGAFDPREAELPFRVVLAQAVSRGDRMDLTLQKAVELGVGTIVPLITARSAPLPSGDRLERRLAGRDAMVAMDPGDLLDQIAFAAQVEPKSRRCDLPARCRRDDSV